jgi:hypothetical protein
LGDGSVEEGFIAVVGLYGLSVGVFLLTGVL